MPSFKNKFIAHSALTSLLVVLSAGLFLWISGEILKSGSTLEDLQIQTRLLEEKRRAVRRASFLLESKTAELARIEGFLVERDRPVKFIEDLEELAAGTANAVSLSVDESSPGGFLIFRVTVEGTQASVFKYLEGVGFLPYSLEIEEVSFQKMLSSAKGGAAGSKREVEARLLLTFKVRTDS